MRRLVVAALLLISSLAASASDHHTPPQATLCWGCHAPGVDDPHMDPPYIVVPHAVQARVGERFVLQVDVVATWLADYRDIYLTLDLEAAPSLAFVGTMEPVDDVRHGNVTATAQGLVSPQRGSLEVEVPAGATTLRLTLRPDTQGPMAPDMRLNVYGPRDQLVASVDDAGAGQAETFRIDSGADIAAMGYGTWRAEAEMTPMGPASVSPGTQWGFTMRFEAWGNASLEREQVAYQKDKILAGQRALLRFPLIVQAAVSTNETLSFTANATAHYDHESISDDWHNFTTVTSTGVRVVPDGAAMGLNATGGTIAVPVQGVSFASISEAIGYAAAMLLITSMVTGGMFGKASRRHLNVVFGSARRRVAFHNFLSYGIVVAALAHMAIFVMDSIEPDYAWQHGLLLGGTGILCMLGLGVTGAMQVPMIRRWNYATWRWVHLGLAVATVAFTVLHMLLDGAHFSNVQDSVGWEDPLVPEARR